MIEVFYAVTLVNGERKSDGVRNQGPQREALERWVVEEDARLAHMYPGIGPMPGWTTVIVDREGLDALPFAADAYRPEVQR